MNAGNFHVILKMVKTTDSLMEGYAMKNTLRIALDLLFCIVLCMGIGASAWAEGIAIDETNFPDQIFRNYVSANCDQVRDRMLSKSEIAATTEFYLSSNNIYSLKGIEYFTSLQRLDCSWNKLTTLDLSSNTALTFLSCYSNYLTSLNVSGNTALTTLDCSGNYLTSLDVSGNIALVSLSCGDNQLTSLDMSSNTALTTLDCSGNYLTSLDMSSNTALTSLYCGENKLTSLDLSGNTALTSLSCSSNQLTSLDVSGNTTLTSLNCEDNQLTSLDVRGNSALTSLSCYSNYLTSLDVSGNTALTSLSCGSNQLTSLDMSGNTALTSLSCGSNQLTSLDVSGNTALTSLRCSSNQLTRLNVSGNTALTSLSCSTNRLTILDVGNNTKLSSLSCYNNLLTSLDISNCSVLLWLVNNITPDEEYYFDSVSAVVSYNTRLRYDKTVTLITDPEKIIFVYFNNNATDAESQMEPQLVNRGEEAVLKACTFTRAGYIFNSWNTEPDGSGTSYADGASITISEDITLYAQWTEGYTIRFDKNADDASGTINPLLVPKGTKITLPNRSYYRNGYSFQGWNTAPDGTGTAYKDRASLTPTEDMTLYAQWIKTYSVRYYYNGPGNGSSGRSVSEGSTITIQPIRDFGVNPPAGKEFDCWNTKPDGSGDSYYPGETITPTADINLYPQWKKEELPYEVVKIDEKNFPDVVFRLYVLNTLDSDRNGSLSNREIAAVTSLNLNYKEIISLKGIEYFSSLTSLDCGDNYLKTLDLSRNTALTSLRCGWNRLTNLDISGCTKLTTLVCADNQLAMLDLNACPALKSLTCYNNKLSELELGSTPALTSLSCYGNSLTSLNLSPCPGLTTLNCNDNRLTSLDFGNNDTLMSLYCGNNLLPSLDLSRHLSLSVLNCGNNQLTNLELSNNAALTSLTCSNNQLTYLNLSSNYSLTSLYCGSNQLKSLNLGNNLSLTSLNCSENLLTSLDLSNHDSLNSVYCYNNSLESLDVSGCTALSTLQCHFNQLKSLSLDDTSLLLGLSCYGNPLSLLDISTCPGLTMLVDSFEPQSRNGVITYGSSPNSGNRRYLVFDEGVVLVCYHMEPDFILPAALTEIGSEAFAGGAFVYVKLPEQAVSVGWHAFADCPNLEYVYISEATTDIHPYAFGVKWGGLTIIGVPGSTAEVFAQAHGFDFVPAA